MNLDRCGIYAIYSRRSGKSYIGSTTNFDRRWEEHRIVLAYGKAHPEKPHSSPLLQSEYDRYGLRNLQFKVVEVCVPARLEERERFHITKVHNAGRCLNANRPGHPRWNQPLRKPAKSNGQAQTKNGKGKGKAQKAIAAFVTLMRWIGLLATAVIAAGLVHYGLWGYGAIALGAGLLAFRR